MLPFIEKKSICVFKKKVNNARGYRFLYLAGFYAKLSLLNFRGVLGGARKNKALCVAVVCT